MGNLSEPLKRVVERDLAGIPPERQWATSTILAVYGDGFRESQWLIVTAGAVAGLTLPLLSSTSIAVDREWLRNALYAFACLAGAAVFRTAFLKFAQIHQLGNLTSQFERATELLNRALVDDDDRHLATLSGNRKRLLERTERDFRLARWLGPALDFVVYTPLLVGIASMIMAVSWQPLAASQAASNISSAAPLVTASASSDAPWGALSAGSSIVQAIAAVASAVVTFLLLNVSRESARLTHENLTILKETGRSNTIPLVTLDLSLGAPGDPGRHYVARNVGTGSAVNCFEVEEPAAADLGRVRPLGSLAPAADTVVPEALNTQMRRQQQDFDRDVFYIAAEAAAHGIWTLSTNRVSNDGRVSHEWREWQPTAAQREKLKQLTLRELLRVHLGGEGAGGEGGPQIVE